jgi:S-adenosylmethionine hydrolase
MRLPSVRLLLPALLFLLSVATWARVPLVLQTDFGLRDGAVGAMKGVALSVDPELLVYDLSHENTPYDVWEAAYRLKQSAVIWPKGTVFVSVVDPGVGTQRRSIVLTTKTGHVFVGPDNGSFTLIADELGVKDVRRIDERHRRPGSSASHTFHGRDVFALVGAEIASGTLRAGDMGPRLESPLVRLEYAKAKFDGQILSGNIPVLDYRYGNVWTSIPDSLVERLKPRPGDTLQVEVLHAEKPVWSGAVPFARTFGDVPEGQPLLYLNSLGDLALAINMGDFAKTHGVGYGPAWSLRVRRPSRHLVTP